MQTLERTLRLEAGNGPAERKEGTMSTHAIGTRGRVRLAAVGIFLASTVAASALTIQAWSVWSTTGTVNRPAAVKVDPYPYKDDWFHDHNLNTAFHRPSLRELEAKKSGM